MADHLWADVDGVEDLAGVDADLGAAHLGDDEHVTEVGPDDGGLLVGGCLLLGLAQLLDKTHGAALEAAREASACAGVDNLHKVLGGHVQERVELMAAVRELAEGAPLLELSGLLGVVRVHAGQGRYAGVGGG